MNIFGCHIIGWTNAEALLNFIGRTQQRVIKVVGPPGHDAMKVAEAKRRSPDSLWLLRYYLDKQPLDNPIKNAGDLANLIKPYAEHYDFFEDYNEIWPFDMELVKRYDDFSCEFGRIVHSWGKKHVTGCWSNGQPPLEVWQHTKESVAQADFLSIHNYGWPTFTETQDLALRHRRLPFRKPLILSEVGLTAAVFHGPDEGWKKWSWPYALQGKEDRAAEQWAWFLDRLNEDGDVFAANIYTTGRLRGDGWGTHDFTERLYKLVGDYIAGHPSPPWEEDKMTDSPLATWREGVPLGNYSKGPTQKTKIVLHSTDGSFRNAVLWFLNPDSKVSAHYVVGRGHEGVPKIYQMVKEGEIAHHAGKWEMNTKAIGIECVDDKLDYLTERQRKRLFALMKDIVKRNPKIGPEDVLLHREVVPTKCPQAISDAQKDLIIAEVFGTDEDWQKKYEDLHQAAVEAKDKLEAALKT